MKETSKIVLSTYFTGCCDPQRGREWPANDTNLIHTWTSSLKRVGLRGIIFHNDLDSSFVTEQTTEHISFEKIELHPIYSTNDWRFFIWLEWMLAHDEIEWVMCTDLFDVEFFKNPFYLLDDKIHLLAGDEQQQPMNSYVARAMIRTYGQTYHMEEIKLVAGIIGGTKWTLVALFRRMCNDFEAALEPDSNINMGVFNKCVYELFNNYEILSGYPLNSVFREEEKVGGFCVRHK